MVADEGKKQKVDRHITRDFYSTLMLLSYGYDVVEIKRDDEKRSDVFVLEKKIYDGDLDAKKLVDCFRRKKLVEFGNLPEPYELLVENRNRLNYFRNLTQGDNCE